MNCTRICLAMLIGLTGCARPRTTESQPRTGSEPARVGFERLPDPLPEDPWEFEHLVWRYLHALREQTGNTDGYPEGVKYNIHQHEPARTIIAIGPRAIPHVKKLLNDNSPTKACWPGRSGSYTLRVSDIAVCILREIGGDAELALLKRRGHIQHQTWLDAREYKDKQDGWSLQEKASYMGRFEDCHYGNTITGWAIQAMEARLAGQDEKPQPSAAGDAKERQPGP